MSPPIRFVKTRWGRVAYSLVGSGRPLIFDTGWISNLETLWQVEGYRGLVGRLARSHQVISFDPPGTGLSDRNDTTTTLAQEVEVLSNVFDEIGVGPRNRASLFSSSIAASTAIRYAARHGDSVHRLVLFGAALKGVDLGSDRARRALTQLVEEHWTLGSRMLSDIFVPELEAPERQWFYEFQRMSSDGATAAKRLHMYYDSDVSEDADRVAAPTLVVHRSGDRAVSHDLGAATASAIEQATLKTAAGSAHLCFLGDWQEIADLVVPFLEAPAVTALPRGPYGELTARELDVAELTMEGLSNSAMGERLGISPRTVETHLVRIRAKLGVSTRAEVAAWMARRAEFS